MNRLDISLLDTLPLFDGLPDDSVRDILENAESGRFDEATTVFNEGQDAIQFYLVLDGIVRIKRATNSGKRKKITTVDPVRLSKLCDDLAGIGLTERVGHSAMDDDASFCPVQFA